MSGSESLRRVADLVRFPKEDLEWAGKALSLRALTDSSDIEGARAALRRYLKNGESTLTPEPYGEGHAYVARAEFLPLVLLAENAATPSELVPGGRCPRVVARACYCINRTPKVPGISTSGSPWRA